VDLQEGQALSLDLFLMPSKGGSFIQANLVCPKWAISLSNQI